MLYVILVLLFGALGYARARRNAQRTWMLSGRVYRPFNARRERDCWFV